MGNCFCQKHMFFSHRIIGLPAHRILSILATELSPPAWSRRPRPRREARIMRWSPQHCVGGEHAVGADRVPAGVAEPPPSLPLSANPRRALNDGREGEDVAT